MEIITYDVYDYLWDRLQYQGEANFSGGENRAYSGLTVETCTDLIIEKFRELYPTLNIEVRNSTDKIKVFGKNGIDFTEESVDRHVYINNRLELIIECKTYLDKCYLQRATDDCRLIRKGLDHPIQAWIISLENAISDSAYNYFMFQDDGIYVDKCFYLSDGKRVSNKPIYKNDSYQTRLNIDKIKIMIEKFDEFFKQFI